ncbi:MULTISPECIES: MalY/PatB family protein [Fusobacterium]|uniref:MalY/PatB family protein n=1 Tax=Fusobacterium TaxID=848 RepID=UPI001F2AF31F|nr:MULTISPECIES: MalY/PatB family protein [Fusobacterium]MCF2612669.1 pyridoxal phosphate-dependent aminotransferase [Fusobacterium perfoetens]MDY2980434.1 MalY/PatB family protein [Fusobacterium sp.]
MKYNFDEIIKRSKRNSRKWNSKYYKEVFNNQDDLLAMWIADMDFRASDGIQNRLKKLVEHGIYGYGAADDEYYDAIIRWNKVRNNWEVPREAIMYTPGIVPAINYILQTYTKEQDNVMIFTPVYGPFKRSILNNKRGLVICPLLKDENNNYSIDFENMEKLMKEKSVKMVIFCSPHNPVGRVWTMEELEKVAEISLNNKALMVCDEIHSDLIFGDNKFISYGNLPEKYRANGIICNAVSKTFNLAGMQVSNVIIFNNILREKYKNTMGLYNVVSPNAFAIEAVKGAYLESDEWYAEMLEYIWQNILFAKKYIDENIPKLKFNIPEGTYLGWIDFNGYGVYGKDLEDLFEEKLKIAIDYGHWFGEEGKGFIRMNFACPREVVVEALERIKKYFEKNN